MRVFKLKLDHLKSLQMANNISKPEIATTITPFLTVKNGAKAVEF